MTWKQASGGTWVELPMVASGLYACTGCKRWIPGGVWFKEGEGSIWAPVCQDCDPEGFAEWQAERVEEALSTEGAP